MTARRRLAALVLVLGLVGLAAACGPQDDNANGGLGGTSWVVMSIAGTSTIEGARPTMAFAFEGAATGTDGCNQYSATFRTDGDAIQVGDYHGTLAACEPDRMAQASAFGSAFVGASSWQLREDGSLLVQGQGDLVAVDAATVAPTDGAPPSGSPTGDRLLDTKWTLVDLDGTADFADLLLTLALQGDGTAGGFSGCNTFNGPWATDGEAFSIGPLATTKMACERPASAVESTYLQALDATGTWAIDEAGQLTLGGPAPLVFAPG